MKPSFNLFSQQTQTHQDIERIKATTISMNKEPTKIMKPCEFIPPLVSELNKTHHSKDTQIETQPKKRPLKLNDCQGNEMDKHSDMQSLLCSETCESLPQEAAALEKIVPSAEEVEVTKELSEGLPEEEEEEEDSGRERLKRHRIEVAGRVWIPDIWGQEEMLKDLIDCSAFDASLVPSGIISARAALVQEGRRANSGGLRIENSC